MSNAKRYIVVLPPLILCIPFFAFLNLEQYQYFSPENFAILLGLLALGFVIGLAMAVLGRWVLALGAAILLAWFVDFEFGWNDWSKTKIIVSLAIGFLVGWHFNRNMGLIAVVAFSVILATTILVPIGSSSPAAFAAKDQVRASSRPQPSSGYGGGLPVIIHILLDAHLGVKGIPTDIEGGAELRSEIQSFYLSNGFNLFGGAYSEHRSTTASLGHVFNFSQDVDDEFVELRPESEAQARDTYQMTSNQYFDRLSEAGYRLFVYHPAHLNPCSKNSNNIARCDGYGMKLSKNVVYQELDFLERLELIAQRYRIYYYENSVLYKNARVLLAWLRGSQAPRDLRAYRPGVAPIVSLKVLEEFATAVQEARPGDFLFAHLIVPHSPFLYDENCQLRPVRNWRLVQTWKDRDAAWRKARYLEYFAQVRCLLKKLDSFLDVIQKNEDNNFVVIVHGDHGSKISIRRPNLNDLETFTPSDYLDSFSTHFAVKLPGVAASYDERPVSIRLLLDTLVRSDFRELEVNDIGPPMVYLCCVGDRQVARPLLGL